MVPIVQFAAVLVLAAAPMLAAAALLRRQVPARRPAIPAVRGGPVRDSVARRRGGDPIAFPLRRRGG
jgi:hypothetical protein